jgi:hypothetical protein
MRAAAYFLPLMVAVCSAGLRAQSAPPVGEGNGSAVVIPSVGPATGITAAPAGPSPTEAVPTPEPRLDVPGNLRLTNLSTRARVTPAHALVTGFVLRGTVSRTVLVRAAGPALHAFGVADAVAAPRLTLCDAAGATLAENAGWGSAPGVAAAITATGAFPFAGGSADAAVVATLAPGSYTATVTVGADAGGVTLVEVYDAEGMAEGSRLANASTLSTVAPAGGEVVGGFVLAGTGLRHYLIRGVGPGLVPFGVGGTLRDPMVTLYDSTGRPVMANDDWTGQGKPNVVTSVALAAGSAGVTPSIVPGLVDLAVRATGAFPLDPTSTDAALVVSLRPGAYTMQLRGVGTTVMTIVPVTLPATPAGAAQAVQAISISSIPPAPGAALLELYEVP